MRSALSRSALLGELRVKKVIDLVPEEVRQIHGLLEAEFNPLQLCKQLAPLIEKLSSLDAPLSQASPVQEAPLAQYQQALRQVCLSLPFRLSFQVLHVYLPCLLPKRAPHSSSESSLNRAACHSSGLMYAWRCHRAAQCLSAIGAHMLQVAVLRAMQQLSEVYSVMTIASLSELVPFFGFSEVEQIIVEAVKQGYLQVRR